MARAPVLLLVTVVVALAGCGGSGDDATRTTPPAAVSAAAPATVASATTTQPVAPAVPKRRVRFRALDGRRVSGVLRRADGPGRAPAVVLLHQSDGGADQWDDFAPVLAQAGYTTLAVEGDGGLLIPELGREARGALRYLKRRPDVDPARLNVVGASVGADAATWTSGTEPRRAVARTVALSPSAELTLLDRADAGLPGPHDVLYVANAQEAPASKLLLDVSSASRRLEEPEGGHGVELLHEARVARAVVDWLDAGRTGAR